VLAGDVRDGETPLRSPPLDLQTYDDPTRVDARYMTRRRNSHCMRALVGALRRDPPQLTPLDFKRML